MLKKILILIALYPLLNFIHEGGHWVGAKAVGLEPVMLLQRVDTGERSQHSPVQISVYNWSGPAVNYVFMVAGYFFPPLIPVSLIMTAHRLGPNLFASFLYLNGNTQFTNDETKQASENSRLYVSIFFSLAYLLLFIYFLNQWLPNASVLHKVFVTVLFPATWFGYLIFLDHLDKMFFTK